MSFYGNCPIWVSVPNRWSLMHLINGCSLILPPLPKWSVSGLCFLKCSKKVVDSLRSDGLLLWRKASMKSVFVAIFNVSVEAQTHPLVFNSPVPLLQLGNHWEMVWSSTAFQLGTLSIGQYIASSWWLENPSENDWVLPEALQERAANGKTTVPYSFLYHCRILFGLGLLLSSILLIVKCIWD